MNPKEVQDAISKFVEYYWGENIRCRRSHQDHSGINFHSFLEKPEYAHFRSKLEEAALKRVTSLEEFLFNHLTDEQKGRIGSLFHRDEDSSLEGELISDENYTRFSKQADIIERAIINTPEFEAYMGVKDYIFDENKEKEKEKRERFAGRIAQFLYEKLTDEQKKLLQVKSIRRYFLNIGFIKSKRSNRRKALEFIKEYPSLFEGVSDVESHIFERWIDEELTTTPIEETQQKINSLKENAQEFYGRKLKK